LATVNERDELPTTRESKQWRFRAPETPRLFDAVGTQHVGRTFCFLCGRRLTRLNRSDEHVFPRWLQHRYDLWNKQITLLNGSHFQYRSLTIPCCRSCNTRYLSPIEAAVERAVRNGPAAVRRLSNRTLLVWLGKIFYGVLLKEGLLRADIRNPASGRLVRRTALRSFRMHHYFLQGARIPMRFLNAFPASIFVYRIQRYHDIERQFDFRDLPAALAVAIRMGSVGIVAALQDGGAQRTVHGSFLEAYQDFPLHPLQFAELIACFFYKATLSNRTPKYMIMEGRKALNVIQMPLQGFSLKPLFDEWDQSTYAQVLAFHTRMPIADIFDPPLVMTWLNGSDGRPRFLSLRENPWP
jgi:hypothetical protein